MAAAVILPHSVGHPGNRKLCRVYQYCRCVESIPLAHWLSGGPVFMRTAPESASDRVSTGSVTLIVAGPCMVPAFQIHRLNIATVKQSFTSICSAHRQLGGRVFTMLERPKIFTLKCNKILYLSKKTLY